MLVNLDQAARVKQFNGQWWLALASALAVGGVFLYFIRKGAGAFELAAPPAPSPVLEGNTERLADVLFSQYLLPFEVASILLLVAVVGSVIMAKKRI